MLLAMRTLVCGAGACALLVPALIEAQLAAGGPPAPITRVAEDFLLHWRQGHGAAVLYRGIPVFTANPGEFVVHRAWQDVYYRPDQSKPEAEVAEENGQTALVERDRAEHFDFEKRVTVLGDGRFRVEYAYELLDPEQAEVQVLFGIGAQWIDGCQYRIVVGGQERTGELKCPDTGRIDPWGGATEQGFTTDYGALTVNSTVPMNLLCEPKRGALWWSDKLKQGERYERTLDVTIEPGPASETGVRLTGIEWPNVVRDGRVPFTLKLARTDDGPESITVRAEPATGSQEGAGEPVEVALAETPAEVQCEATAARKGHIEFAVVIAGTDGAELLRLAPLGVQSSPLLRIMPRLSLYTHEDAGQIVVDLAEDADITGLSVTLTGAGIAPVRQDATGHRMLVGIDVSGLPNGVTEVNGQVLRGNEVLAQANTTLRKAEPQANEVKIDNVSRSLVVDGLPFVPFGYYTYFPLKAGVMDEEVVRGFNLFSPYHGGPHEDDQLTPIRDYLDRCAAIGMKVNYHLMWSNRAEMTEEQWAALRGEVEAFRDHPALLTWYIADEPTADRVPHLERVYNLLKELDPHHPVTVVFYRGAEHARKFTGTMDIVMGDPYPIPNSPVTYVSTMADSLNEAFDFGKALWIVPQAFGGNEWWRREPTAQEQRVMTYLSLIHGARGIQYFIRSPRTSFPKSPIMWAECGALALETAELTPALTSGETPPTVTSSVPAVHACALLDRGVVTVLATNTENRPLSVKLSLEGVDFSGEADVLFENRKVAVTTGAIEEPIDAFGSRAYAIPLGPPPEDDLSVAESNLTVNPSWENNPSVGTPAGCYASIPHGATAAIDSRVGRHGRHSLRLTAPTDDATPSLSPFPVRLTAAQEYRVSVWAKGRADGVRLKLALGEMGETEPALTTAWQEYSFTVTPEKDIGRAGLSIGLAGAGVAWVDLLQIVPVGE